VRRHKSIGGGITPVMFSRDQQVRTPGSNSRNRCDLRIIAAMDVSTAFTNLSETTLPSLGDAAWLLTSLGTRPRDRNATIKAIRNAADRHRNALMEFVRNGWAVRVSRYAHLGPG
jgi:hypothetical protein